jgi:LuxR family maltose regulon positive regulatory protein
MPIGGPPGGRQHAARRGPAPLLVTQVAMPAPPAGIVLRPRLAELLGDGLDGFTTLVCAPAGSGKTSLLSAELRREELPPPAWVSLGVGDDEPGRFWGMVLASLRAAGVVPEGSALDTLAPPVRESRRGFMPLLVNALAELEDPVVLVLDDLHLVRSRECLSQLAFLLLHAPVTLRLVLSTRSDPALPLHLLRVRGQLVEIRAADLAFTEDEAAALLATHGVTLTDELVGTLCARTEGWGAGLRLAALSLKGRDEPARFVEEFAGDDRAVGDYLLAEVLDRQPPRLRRFLLRTSIVERICGDLADALTDDDAGADALATLELTNGFVIGLDSRREWYRYHRLFAKLLRMRARSELGGELAALHRRAARWYADHGEEEHALGHAVQAQDWDLGTALAAQHWFELFVRGQSDALRGLVDAIPVDRLDRDAELAAAMACTALDAGDTASARRHLDRAASAETGLPEDRRRAYLETMALARLYLARQEGDFDGALSAADTLLEEAAGHGAWSHDARRALVHGKLGETALWAFRFDRARAELHEAIALARAIGLDYVAVGALAQLSLLEQIDVGPERSVAIAREAISLAERRGWVAIPQTAGAHATLAAAALLSDLRPDDAEQHLSRARDALADVDLRQIAFLVAVVSARVHAADGRPDDALHELQGFEVTHRSLATTPFERTMIACTRVRVLTVMGDLQGARNRLAEVAGEPWPVVAATEARMLLAEGDAAAAVDLLTHASSDVDLGTAVERLVTLAIAHDATGDTAAASRAVEEALEDCERSGHRWPFIEAGRRMENLLRAQIRHGTAHRAIVGELIAAFEDRLPVRRAVAPLLEPLSDREQAILRYLPTTLSNREIASELFVTTNTVKTHLRSIYRKLDVARRRDAVDRARDLRLLSSGLGR